MAEYNNQKVVPLVVKKGPNMGSGAQKFRLPFKNNGASEIEIEFSFAKQTAVIQGPASSMIAKEGNQGSNENGEKPQSPQPLT